MTRSPSALRPPGGDARCSDPEPSRVFRDEAGFSRDVPGSSEAAETLVPSAFPQRLRAVADEPFLCLPSWTSPVRPRSPALREPLLMSGVLFFASRFVVTDTRSSNASCVAVGHGSVSMPLPETPIAVVPTATSPRSTAMIASVTFSTSRGRSKRFMNWFALMP